MTHNEQAHSDRARWHSAPAPRSMTIGDLRVSYVHDGAIQMSPTLLLPDSDPNYWTANPHLLDSQGYLVLGAGGLLVQGEHWSILIDTGFGPIDAPKLQGLGEVTGGALLASLGDLGVAPADLTAIAITHLHPDHIGWWTNGADNSGKSPFATLPAYIGIDEWRHAPSAHHDPEMKEFVDTLTPTVRPVEDGTTIAPGVSVLSSAGHTVGHTSFVIESRGETLIAFGDTFHSVAQIAHPVWAAGMDHNAETARHSRAALLQRLTQPHTYGFGIHFADVTFGRVVSDADRHCWQPVA